MGPKNSKWWNCKDEMMVEYREKVRKNYDELDAKMVIMEGEWRQYKDAFVGVAEELCGRTSVSTTILQWKLSHEFTLRPHGDKHTR